MRPPISRLVPRISVFAALASIALAAACATGDSNGEPKASAEEPNQAIPIERELEKGMAAEPRSPSYRLLIAQGGTYQKVEEHRVTLAPEPFTIHVMLTPDAKVMVNISRDPTNRDRVVEGKEPEGRVGHPATGMAERPYNEDRSVMVDKNGSNYWIADPEGKHSFDEVRERDGMLVARRGVEYIFERGADEPVPIEEMAGSKLHVVEFAAGAGPRQPRQPKRAYTIEFEEK